MRKAHRGFVIKSKYLTLLFRTLNTLLFKGQLPDIAIIKRDLEGKYDGMYCTTQEGVPIAILIEKSVPVGPLLIQVLLHEMTHYYCDVVLKDTSPLEHSPIFVRVLTRVYRKMGLPRRGSKRFLMMKVLRWVWYLLVEAIMLIFTLLGLPVLILPCLRQAWEPSPAPSIKDGRPIDRWKSKLLRLFYGNPEDGVSGQTAFVNGADPYLPGANPKWRAYRWSAIRNSCDNLKYIFAYSKGPIYTTTWLKIGWQMENGYNVPVFSLGKQ